MAKIISYSFSSFSRQPALAVAMRSYKDKKDSHNGYLYNFVALPFLPEGRGQPFLSL
jgi:hypothetical protein